MSRQAVIIGRCLDVFGRAWDIREDRPTKHGWPVRIGWPQDIPRGPGCGGPKVVITEELANYMEETKDRPNRICLPIGKSAIKRIRKILGYNWIKDNQVWWKNRCMDTTSTITDFQSVHGKSSGAISNHRDKSKTVT